MLCLAVPGLALCALYLASSSADDLATPLTGILAICAVLGSRVSFDIEGTLFWDGSFLPMICAAALLGPMPTAAITVASEVAVWRRERYAPRVLPLNLFGTLAPNLVAAWLLSTPVTGTNDELFYAILAAAVCGSVALNAVLITVLAGILYSAPILGRLRRHRAIAAPIAINVVLAMGAVAVYRSEGLGATAFVIAGVLVFAFVANRLRAERENRSEIAALAASRGRLVAQLLEAEDRERRVVAEAIHDELVQTLLSVRQDLAEEGGAGSQAAIRIEQAVRQARGIIRGTHPSVLDQVGLDAAVRAIAEQAAIRGGLVVGVTVGNSAPGLHDRLVFAAIRELLSNVMKHARASKVAISVENVTNEIRLSVIDDGVGISAEETRVGLRDGHIGLVSLTERAEGLGGALRVRRLERGTEVQLVIPVPRLPRDPTLSADLASVSKH